MTTCAEYQTQLDALYAAKQKALTGGSITSFAHGENQESRRPPDMAALEREIRRLEMKVDACNGVSSSHRIVRTIPTDGNGRW